VQALLAQVKMASLVHYVRMASAVSVRGHLSDARHIELDQPLDMPWGPVEIILRAVADEPKDQASIVGLFSDAPELMDEVSNSAMAARERD